MKRHQGVTGFIYGFSALIRGFILLFQGKGLGSYLVFSLLANLTIISLLGWGGWKLWDYLGTPLVTNYLPGWLIWAPGILTIACLAVVAFFLFPLLIPIIATPFLEPLAKKIESHILGRPAPDQTGNFLHAIMRDLITASKLLAMGIIFALACLLTAPFGFGLFLALPLGSWLAAVSWIDYPLARRGLSWPQKKAWIKNHFSPCMGFGLAVSLSFFLPIFNLLLAAPTAVAGAGWLYIRLSETPKGG